MQTKKIFLGALNMKNTLVEENCILGLEGFDLMNPAVFNFLPSYVGNLYEGLEQDRNYFLYDLIEDEPKFHRRENSDNVLGSVEYFVRKIEAGHKAFDFSNGMNYANCKKGRLAKYYPLMNAYLRQYCLGKIYSPHVQAFFDVCEKRKLTYGSFPSGLDGIAISRAIEIRAKGSDDSCNDSSEIQYRKSEVKINFEIVEKDIGFGWSVFNQVVSDIRNVLVSREFKKKIYAVRSNIKRGFNSSQRYVDALFQKYSRMLVIRIDLGFSSKNPNLPNSMKLEDVKNKFSRFLSNSHSKKLYKKMVGYIWRLEYGEEKGLHYHLFIFFDGAKSRNDSYLANEIGKDWQKVVGERGIYHNCNASKQRYKNLAIGMISHDDVVSRNNMVGVLIYMHKQEQMLQEKFLKNGRIWGRGEMPKVRNSAVGRPRRSLT